MSSFCVVFLSAIVIATIIGTAAYADEQGSITERSIEAGSAETSKQVLDKRLPPVMPGQEVTINGKKMNVWSTSGEVPVSQPPEPWRKDSLNIKDELHGAEVIVDQRRDSTRPNRGN